jgi:hypothetical protein
VAGFGRRLADAVRAQQLEEQILERPRLAEALVVRVEPVTGYNPSRFESHSSPTAHFECDARLHARTRWSTWHARFRPSADGAAFGPQFDPEFPPGHDHEGLVVALQQDAEFDHVRPRTPVATERVRLPAGTLVAMLWRPGGFANAGWACSLAPDGCGEMAGGPWTAWTVRLLVEQSHARLARRDEAARALAAPGRLLSPLGALVATFL